MKARIDNESKYAGACLVRDDCINGLDEIKPTITLSYETYSDK